MPSTYTTNGGIELIATGEQSGTWGDTTNANLNIIDRLTNGVGAITLSGTTHTLTTSDGTLSDGQYRVLVFGGSPSGTNTVTISPNDAQHLYFVKNGSGQSVVLSQGSGTTVTVADGKSAIVYSDGGGASANVVDLTSTFNFQPLTATLTAIGALAVTDGNIIVGNGSTWVAESGATARTSLGLGSGDNVTFAQVDIAAQGDLRLQDTTGGEYVALQAPGTVSASYTLTLPAADGTSGQAIVTDGAGTLSFVSFQAATATLTAIGALAVTDGNIIVGNGSTWVAESGATARTSLGLGTGTPTNGQLLIGNGTDFTTAALTAGTNISVTNASGSVTVGIDAAAGISTFLTTPSSANLAAAVSDETGSGALVFGTKPTITGLVETNSALGTGSGTQTFDLNNGNYFTLTTNGTTTLAVSNVPASGSVGAFIVQLTNGGGYTVNYFSGITWAAGTAPTLTTTGTDVLGFFTTDGGTTWRGLVLALDIKAP